MLTIPTKPQTSDYRLTATSMPDHDWWESLWSHPQATLQALGLKPGMSVLDLGCGYGHFTIAAAEMVYPALVVGADVDGPILLEAQAAARLDNCLWLNQDLLSLSQRVFNKFDYVMMHSTFHGLASPVNFVANIVDLLNPGGCFSVINWLPISREDTIWMGKPRGPKTELRLSEEQFLTIVQTANSSLAVTQRLLLPPYHYGVTLQLQ